MRIFAALLLLGLASEGWADEFFFDSQFSSQDIRAVEVILRDDAKGACWTNLKEVREYAEEKFRANRIPLLTDTNIRLSVNQEYNYVVQVFGNRTFEDGSGPCSGFISITLFNYVPINNRVHVAVAGQLVNGYLGVGSNLNREVIKAVQYTFESLN